MDALFQNEWFYIIGAAWTLPWKGWALWRAARRESKFWFIILMVVNTFGLVEILYVFFGDKLAEKYKKWMSARPKKAAAAK